MDGFGNIRIGRTYADSSEDESSPVTLKRNTDKDETVGVIILMTPDKIKENKDRMDKIYRNVQALEEELARRMKSSKR